MGSAQGLKRHWGGLAALCGLAALLAATGPLAAQTVKVGVILSYSGPAASIGADRQRHQALCERA